MKSDLSGILSAYSNGPTSIVSMSERRNRRRIASLSHSWTTTLPRAVTSATRAMPVSSRLIASWTASTASVSADDRPSRFSHSSSMRACRSAMRRRLPSVQDMIRHLPRVVPEAPDKPTRGSEDHPMRKVTRQVAFDPGGWTGERRGKVETLFDALARGEVGGRVCLELGSGTGIATPWLAERFSLVLAVELSAGMLELAPAGVGTRMRADGSRLPLRDGSIDAAVLVNMFLF